jgi:DNA topoisomerase-1
VNAIVDLADRTSVGPAASPAEAMESALEASGYLEAVRSGDRAEDRLANLDVLFEAAAGFADVASLLDELDRQSAAAGAPLPRTASLFQTMTLERITFEDAMQLLSLPRVVGVDPIDGVEITVQNGRFGPYLRKGSDSRSLETEEQLLTIGLDGCLAVLAQPKRRGRAAAKPPLRELGVDPVSNKTIVLKDGNWGPYVTDGEYNASLKRGDAVEELTDERAAELLAERRMKGPAKKRR